LPMFGTNNLKGFNKLTGLICDIKKFALFDGPGIRTTVFFKGCPLNCWWCQNPEAIRELPEEAPTNGNPGNENVVGKKISVEALMEEIQKDSVFYEESDGGVTFSGGEPLLQSVFLKAVLDYCKESGIHTALDTSGYAPWSAFEKINPIVDLFLYDIKLIDEKKHIKYTGFSNDLILKNLAKLPTSNDVVIRIPLIPGITDTTDNLDQIIKYLKAMPQIIGVELLPFNHFSKSKYKRFNFGLKIGNVKTQTSQELEQIAWMFKDLQTSIHIRN
jgi:pyruvate formate lyase activating enzyme